MLAEGPAREVGKGVAGKAEDKRQQQISPVNTERIHAEESREGIADGDTAEQPRHGLGKLHLSSLEDGISKSAHHFCNQQHFHVFMLPIIPQHNSHGIDNANCLKIFLFHSTADTLLQLHCADTCQQAQCDQHHDGRCPQHHPHEHRHADDGHQHSGL